MNNFKQQIDYWKQSAERNLKVSVDLYERKHRDACLFFCHLSLEKLLKGLIVQHTDKPAPYLHDLTKLAFIAGLELTEQEIEDLRTITTFNIAARYDEIKFAFHKKCTPSFTKHYLDISKKLFLCLKKKYPKK